MSDVMYAVYKRKYSCLFYKDKSLLDWATLWFKMSNDSFFQLYGFNFNPHKYPGLYEIARNEVFG